MVQEGSWYFCRHSYSPRPAMGNLSIANGMVTTLAKPGIRPIVNVRNSM
jgi:hypothetical protein